MSTQVDNSQGAGSETRTVAFGGHVIVASGRRYRLVIVRSGWIGLELRDAEGDPVAGESFQILDRNGKVLKAGTTDANGGARVEGITTTKCSIVYPERDHRTWVFGALRR